jgi:hypothetical protein
MKSDLSQVVSEICAFRDECKWKQFNSPHNLSAVLAIETGELQEPMLWKTDDEVHRLMETPDAKKKFSAEIADVLIHLRIRSEVPRRCSISNFLVKVRSCSTLWLMAFYFMPLRIYS